MDDLYDVETDVVDAADDFGEYVQTKALWMFSRYFWQESDTGTTISVSPLTTPVLGTISTADGVILDHATAGSGGQLHFFDLVDTGAGSTPFYQIMAISETIAEVWHVTIASRVPTITKLTASTKTFVRTYLSRIS